MIFHQEDDLPLICEAPTCCLYCGEPVRSERPDFFWMAATQIWMHQDCAVELANKIMADKWRGPHKKTISPFESASNF